MTETENDDGDDENTCLLHQDEERKEPDTTTGLVVVDDQTNHNVTAAAAAASTSSTTVVPWFRVALLFVASSFSLPTFVTGIDIYQNSVNKKNAMAAVIAGNTLLALAFALCGMVGARTRLHSYHLARRAFGRQGAAVFNLVFAISLLGWYMVNLNIFDDSVRELFSATTTPEYPTTTTTTMWIPCVGGLVITVTTMFGFWALERLALLLAPILAVVAVLLLKKSWVRQELEPNVDSLVDADDDDSSTTAVTMPLGQAISSVVGLSIVGAIISSDYTRFVHHWTGVIWSAIAAAVVTAVVECAGGWASKVFQEENLLQLMRRIGLQNEALAILIAGCWILNAMNLYSLSLSLEATFPTIQRNRALLIGVVGFAGTVLAAFYNILNEFLEFLFYLSITFAPVSGVVVMDYIFVRRDAYDNSHQGPVLLPAYRPAALLAWTIGITAAIIGLTGIAALDAFIAASVSYLVMGTLFCRRIETS